MLKRNLVLLLTFGISFYSFSQEILNKNMLQNFATQHRKIEDADRAKAVAMAKLKGWSIHKVTKNGTVMDLKSIDERGNPVYYTTYNNTIAAATTRANQLWPGGSSGLNLSGSSAAVKSKLGTWDGGLILKNHVEFVPAGGGSRVLQKDSATAGALDDHATHTTGTMIAAGVNPIAKGMAFGMQQLIAYTFSNDISKMTTEAPNLLLSNHSYGFNAGWLYDGTNYNWYGDTSISTAKSYLFGYYDGTSQLIDSLAYNAPYYLIDFAAGNANGNQSNFLNNGVQYPAIGSTYLFNGTTTKYRTANIPNNPTYGSLSHGYQCAKNILEVGAANGLPNGYSSPSDVQIADFSSWGPTNDGRIKPDIVADGVNVTSTVSTSTTSYGMMSGTSMATPNATGSLLLVQEYYNQKHPGSFMRSATLKALAIQTADEAGSSPGPDYTYGYGLLNVLRATNVITSSYNQKTDTIIEKTLTSGTPYTINVIASGNGPLKATLVWTDPTGAPDNTAQKNSTTAELVHDLDLRITSGTSTYFPWILNPNSPTSPATKGDDKINNVEQVLVDSSVVPGKIYTITVSNKGNLARGTQAFSLIISGIGGSAYCTSASTNTTGSRIDSVSFSNITNKNVSGHSSYSNFTNLTANIQSNQTIPISIKVNSSDGSSANRVVKVYIDYNNNGTFTDAGEFVANNYSTLSSINGTGGIFTANITTPNLTIGNYGVMRIVLQDTVSGTTTVGPCGTYLNGETQDYRFQVVAPNNDVAMGNILDPISGNCANSSQFITVNVKNIGNNDQVNVPLVAVIKNGTTTVATLNGSYNNTLLSGTNVNYTFNTPFSAVAGTTYTVSVYTNLSGDQNHSNDTLTQSILIANKPALPVGTADICGSNVLLNVTSPVAGINYFWYTSATGSSIATATSTTTTIITSDKNYYLSSGYRGNIGPLNKNTFTGGGGYNNFAGNYVNITTSVPLTINYAKLYIGNPGPITFMVAQLSNVTSTSYSYLPISSTTINAYLTASTAVAPTGSSANPDDPKDSGAYYYLNLSIPTPGSYAIIINPNTTVNTTIFRNNGVTSNPYPISIPNVFSITGNSVTSPSNFQNYYYFFYDMRISTSDCVSDIATIAAATAPTPVVTQSGSSLVSSVTTATSYQWYTSTGTAISGATSSTYNPSSAGSYYITITDAYGCQRSSNVYAYVVTAVVNASNTEIGLKTSPNPSNGTFNVSFTVNTKANVNVELINAAGQSCMSNSYGNFAGQFSQQYNVNVPAGTYIIKVQQNNKVYREKIIIIR